MAHLQKFNPQLLYTKTRIQKLQNGTHKKKKKLLSAYYIVCKKYHSQSSKNDFTCNCYNLKQTQEKQIYPQKS